MALKSYFLSPASEPQLTNPDEVHEAIRGSQGHQGFGPERYTEQDTEAPSQASGFLPRPYIQRGSPHPSLSSNVEARSSDLYP